MVATPIGNLDDFSPRARETLARVEVIAAEDTRTSRKLLPPREQPPRWVSLHEHNEPRAVGQLIEQLQAGRDVALLSDAGTPLISDPGYRLVSAAHDRQIEVSPIPGPCAATAALSAAGLATDHFWFEGFLPARAGARREKLRALRRLSATLVIYVPARDLPSVLEDAATEIGGERPATVARELTKQFETIRRATLAELGQWVREDADQQRGEAVLLVGACERDDDPKILVDALARELAAELPPARAARILTRVSGLDRRTAFGLIESLRKD
ncbi:MAG: 16S rRNA (cytidine(1402)-2'-O)-methyltransferase [Wenzhouxiangellaceae bacterium]|nr:16S rRNA (cytidine(1402)-2'-O)-methyltransferase [Wenzhouxiangellaceae bacterium]